MDADGNLAAAFDEAQESPLRRSAETGIPMIQESEQFPDFRVVRAALDGKGPLADGGETHVTGEGLFDTVCVAETGQAGCGEDDGVILAFIQFPEPCVHVAPQVTNVQIGAPGQELGLAAQARRADDGSLRKVRPTVVFVADKGIADGRPFRNGCQAKPLGQLCRHVFQTVDGQIDLSFQQVCFDFFGEQSLSPDLGKGNVENLIARRDDFLQFHRQVRVALFQAGLDVMALP